MIVIMTGNGPGPRKVLRPGVSPYLARKASARRAKPRNTTSGVLRVLGLTAPTEMQPSRRETLKSGRIAPNRRPEILEILLIQAPVTRDKAPSHPGAFVGWPAPINDRPGTDSATTWRQLSCQKRASHRLVEQQEKPGASLLRYDGPPPTAAPVS